MNFAPPNTAREDRSTVTRFDPQATLADVDPRIPVRLLTGPRGSGKTSVIRHLMCRPEGRLRAHIVPDRGAFDPLPPETSRPDGRTAVLENGSVCFRMHECDVIEALSHLHLRRMGLVGAALPYDEVIIEIAADAAPLAALYQLLTDSRLALTYRFDAIITVVDAAAARGFLGKDSPLTPFVARSDIVILNKSDLVSNDDCGAVISDLAGTNPFAPVHVARHGAVSAFSVMEWNPLGREEAAYGREIALDKGAVELTPLDINGPARRAIKCLVNNSLSDPRSNAESGRMPIRAAHVTLEGSADIFRIARTVARIAERCGSDLYRLKCITANPKTDHPVVFQYIDGAFIPPSWGEPDGTKETRATVVGRGFKPREIMAEFAACFWDSEAIARGAYAPF
ncbi:MAG: GTP-binding protein [Paracoccaceae bacterium]